MGTITITPLYAGLSGLMLLGLAFLVIRLRREHRVPLGDGGIKALHQAIRVQANFTEYVPLALVLILLVEVTGHPAWLVHALGAVLVIARLLHVWGLSRRAGTSFGRFFGTLGTFLVLLAASGVLLVRSIV